MRRSGAYSPSSISTWPLTNACDVVPNRDDLGLIEARVIAPGGPDRSVLLARIRSPDLHRMPPLGSLRVDDEGVALVEAWIAGMAGCAETR